MDFIWLKTSFLRSAEFLNADKDAKGTWICVMGYCVEQENHGRIVGGETWEDRQWQRAAGIDADDIKQGFPLLKIENGDVIVAGYPDDKQTEVEAKRISGIRGANSRWKADPKAYGRQKDPSASKSPSRSANGTPIKEPMAHPMQSRVDEIRGEESRSGTLSFLADYFMGCHPACSACNQMAVENILRGEDPQLAKEAIDDFAKQWAGSDFPMSSPPLKEFSKYLRQAGNFHKKKKNGGEEKVDFEARPPRFTGRSANDP